MRIIKLEVPGEGYYVLIEAWIEVPDKLECVWVRIPGRKPVREYQATQYINWVKNVLNTEAETEIIEHSDPWGRLPEGVEGRVI